MKRILVFLTLTFLFIQPSYCQSVQSLSVPVLQESKKIDKLMDEVLNPKNAHRSSTQTSSDSCFWIYFFKANDADHFIFQIEKDPKSIVNVLINNIESTNPNLGCFIYKQYKIFVEPEGDLYKFFSKTTKVRTFDFIYKLDHPQNPGNGYYQEIWHYQYNGDSLSIEGPPKVMMLEKN